jgi:selenocysteine lyase/cysteine desulfurase
VAELIQVRPESVAFTRNTTSGLGLVASGLDWQPGDNVVGVDGEFPSNIYPWMSLKSAGVEFRLYRHKEGRIDPKSLLSMCDARTRLVTISAVQFWSGFRTDVHAIGAALQRRDTFLVVDAMQAVGGLEIKPTELGIDFLCAGGHKWMLGPLGIGFAYIGPRIFEQLHPAGVGADSVVRDTEYFDYDLNLRPDARRFEEGAANLPGILGLGAAVNLLLRAGPATVESTVLRLADRLRQELPGRGYRLVFTPSLPSERSGIVSFRHPRAIPAELQVKLRAAGVILAHRGDFLRASPHYYNNDQDIDRLLDALPRG